MKKYRWQFWKKDTQTAKPQLSQLEQVMTHLLKRGSITTWQAITEYDITRLSAVIYRLKNEQGMRIDSNLVTTTNKKGNTKRFTVYTLNRG